MPIILQGPFIGDRQSCRGCRHLRGFRHQTILRYGFHRRRNRHRRKTGYLRRKNRVARFAAAYRTACPWSADWDCSGETRRSCVPSVCRCSRGSCPTGVLCFPAVFGCQTIPVAKPPCRSGGQAARRSGCACPYGLPKPWRDSPIPSRSPSSADSARPSSCRTAVVPGPGCIVRPAPQTVIIPR